MVNSRNTHTASRTGRQPLERLATHRPTGRSDQQRPEVRHIDDVLVELADNRKRYEDLRNAGGPLDERARLLSMLHELRAEASLARNSSRRM